MQRTFVDLQRRLVSAITGLMSFQRSSPPGSTSPGSQIVDPKEDDKPQLPKSPPRHRHDGKSPLPLGMDWSLPPRKWDGRNTIWPLDPRTGWSYTVTIPSWIVSSKSKGPDLLLFFRVQVGLQSPEGITSISSILRQHSDFVALISELKRAFPGKKFAPVPLNRALKMKSTMTTLEEARQAMELWLEKLLADINVSRSVVAATFLELEAAVRLFFCDVTEPTAEIQSDSDISVSSPDDQSSKTHDEQSLESSSQVNASSSTSNLKHGSFSSDRIFSKGIFTKKVANEMGSVSWEESLYLPDVDYQRLDGHVRSLSSDNNIVTDLSCIHTAETLTLASRDDINEPIDDRASNNVDSARTSQSIQFSSGSVVLPSEAQQKLNRVLNTLLLRLSSAKTDMEDLMARLNQEIAVRQFLTTKVKNLELDLQTTTINCNANMEQAVLTERERFTQMQWDVEDLRRQCMDLELKLQTEQEEKERAENAKTSIVNENKLILLQLEVARNELRKLHGEYEELELKSKADVKLLVKEVKSLRAYQSELKQEIGRLMKEKMEFERSVLKEKRRSDDAKAANSKLLHECRLLRNRLEECSVNFLSDEEDRLTVDASSPSDAIDLLATSDNRIGLLLAEAMLLAEDVENAAGKTDANSGGDADGLLRKMLTEMFVDNARLRMQANAVMRSTLTGLVKSDEDDADDLPSARNVLIKFIEG